jgi:hypothetical protein
MVHPVECLSQSPYFLFIVSSQLYCICTDGINKQCCMTICCRIIWVQMITTRTAAGVYCLEANTHALRCCNPYHAHIKATAVILQHIFPKKNCHDRNKCAYRNIFQIHGVNASLTQRSKIVTIWSVSLSHFGWIHVMKFRGRLNEKIRIDFSL